MPLAPSTLTAASTDGDGLAATWGTLLTRHIGIGLALFGHKLDLARRLAFAVTHVRRDALWIKANSNHARLARVLCGLLANAAAGWLGIQKIVRSSYLLPLQDEPCVAHALLKQRAVLHVTWRFFLAILRALVLGVPT